MADQRPSTSQQRPQQQQQQQQQQDQGKLQNRNNRKRRLSMNRKKGNKKGARKQQEEGPEPRSPLLEPLIQNLSACQPQEEMQALMAALQPTPADVDIALNMVKYDLRRVLVMPGNQATIYEFGSIKSGLLMKDSDLDFYVHYAREKNEREEQTKLIHIICSRMDKDPNFANMVKIVGAKVPLLRAVHVRTNLQCDINFSNARGCYNSKFIYAVMKFDARIHHLTLIVKFWAQCAYILTPHRQMNSYCLIMMVIFYLQTRKLPVIPSVEDMQHGIGRINFGPWNLGYPQEITYRTWNVNSVRELLVGFFKYYSEFDFAGNLISPFVGRLCSLEELEKKTIRELATYYRAVEREDYPALATGPCISIQDPFELNVNVGKVLRTNALLEQMKYSFTHAYAVCQRFQGKEFAKLLIALFTEVERFPKQPKQPPAKPAGTAAAAKPNGTVDPQPGPSGTASNSTPSSVPAPVGVPKNGCWYKCRLPPIENELYLVKQILLVRERDRKTIITDERVRQLWSECMLDFIVDILRKLYMVQVEPIDTPPAESAIRTYLLTCARQVFIARKRINISNEQDLKREIEISKERWAKNHAMKFKTRAEMVAVDGAIELRVPNDQPKNGPFRLFIDTCFLVHIRKCLRGYFMVMLAKAEEKARQAKAVPVTSTATDAATAMPVTTAATDVAASVPVTTAATDAATAETVPAQTEDGGNSETLKQATAGKDDAQPLNDSPGPGLSH
uniref:PAP-associated domain-containing protein n=1 Tax=Anopheles dirus TaxID=7168 RepID=A0A9I3EI42_9DIPT